MPNKPKQKTPAELKRIGTGRVRISASLKPGLEKELDRIAVEDGINKSQMLQRILTKEILLRRRRKSNG